MLITLRVYFESRPLASKHARLVIDDLVNGGLLLTYNAPFFESLFGSPIIGNNVAKVGN